tara:strand:- start:203 stop:433 length:231 start_codon:yes stop_codon:yes gene_type:complete
VSHPSFENFNAFFEFFILAFEFVDEIPEIIVTCSEVYGVVAVIDFLIVIVIKPDYIRNFLQFQIVPINGFVDGFSL